MIKKRIKKVKSLFFIKIYLLGKFKHSKLEQPTSYLLFKFIKLNYKDCIYR